MLIDTYIYIHSNVCINYAFDGKLSHNAAEREQPLPHPDHRSAEYYIGQPPYWYSPNGIPRNHAIANPSAENENSDEEELRAHIAALPRVAPMPKRMPKARAPPSNYQAGGSSSSSTAPVIVIDAPQAVAPPTQTRPPPPPAHSSSHQRPNGSPIPPWRQPLQLRPPPQPPPRGLTVQELWRMNSHRIQMQ